MAGVAHLMVIKGPWSGTELWTKGYTQYNIRIYKFAQASKDPEISPFLLACANYASFNPPVPYTPYTDGAGTAHIPPRWGPVVDAKGRFYWNSHKFKGLNVFGYDGSARWVRWNEVTWMSLSNETGHFLSNHYALGGNFNEWCKKKAELAD